jgi:Flp pilus assembly protein TadD
MIGGPEGKSASQEKSTIDALPGAATVTTAEMLGLGIRQQRAGNLWQAEQVYRQLLEIEPTEPEAWHLLGALCHVQGRLQEAVEHYRRSLALQPNRAETQNNLGAACDALGRATEAIASFQEVVRLKPDSPDAYFSLASICTRQGDAGAASRYYAEAVPRFRQLLELQPHSADALYKLGRALIRLGRMDEALDALQPAVQLLPNAAEAHNDLGYALAALGHHEQATGAYRQAIVLRSNYALAHNNLGTSLVELGSLVDAVEEYQEALRLQPDYPEAHHNLGLALVALQRHEEAVRCYRQAIRLKPAFAAAHADLGVALLRQGEFAEAEKCLRRAIDITPEFAEAHSGLGALLQEQGDLEGAMVRYEEALRLKADCAFAHSCRAMIWLVQGKLEQGWAEYEWRWRCKGAVRRSFDQPQWDGSPLKGRTILLHAEQGLGDTIQFVRYASLVQERGGRVVLGCQKPLLQLLSRSPGIDQLVVEGSALPPFDVHLALLSGPHILGTTLATVPARVPYVSADPDLVEHWRRELRVLNGLKVGIVWQGNPAYNSDRRRSIPLIEFALLARLPNVHLVSLQNGVGLDQLTLLPKDFRVLDFGDRLDQNAGPFMDTAAIMMNLDLVIAPDTAIAHLAGALGARVWVAVARNPNWRWLLGRDDTPWYPTARLFRQRENEDWSGVMQRMAAAVEELRCNSAS